MAVSLLSASHVFSPRQSVLFFFPPAPGPIIRCHYKCQRRWAPDQNWGLRTGINKTLSSAISTSTPLPHQHPLLRLIPHRLSHRKLLARLESVTTGCATKTIIKSIMWLELPGRAQSAALRSSAVPEVPPTHAPRAVWVCAWEMDSPDGCRTPTADSLSHCWLSQQKQRRWLWCRGAGLSLFVVSASGPGWRSIKWSRDAVDNIDTNAFSVLIVT